MGESEGPTPGHEVLDALATTFRAQKVMAEKAIVQVPDERLHTALDAETNSIAVIAKHLSGNLLSRFTDFLTSDGEKPWRDRDSEFLEDDADRAEIMRRWEAGWACVLGAVAALTPEDLPRTVFIRSEAHTVALALHRSLAHVSYHTGQIVQIARMLSGPGWKTITVPRGGTREFNRSKGYMIDGPAR